MRAVELFQALAWTFYTVIFLFVFTRTLRRPTRMNVDTSMFFGLSFLTVAIAVVTKILPIPSPSWLTLLRWALTLALPYLLLRLVASYSEISAHLLRLAELGVLLSVITLVATGEHHPVWVILLLVINFSLTMLVAAILFMKGARRMSGVTRRRQQTVALGTVFVALDALCVGFAVVNPANAPRWAELGSLLGMASGLSYLLGFVTPTPLRRAWQEPELRAFLGRAAQLPRLPEIRDIIYEMERGAASSLGAPGASIQIWDPARRTLRGPFNRSDGQFPTGPLSSLRDGRLQLHDGWWERSPDLDITGRVFREQKAIFVEDASHVDPANAAVYEFFRANTVLAAPISAGKRPLGVLAVYSSRAPIFADSDLELVQLIADVAAVILESRALIDEVARIQAGEEAVRMKEDFLSSAAHDLKSPLTGIIGHSQFLRRRLERRPNEPLLPQDLDRIITEARRLDGFIRELLDASRSERGLLVDLHETIDLTELAREVCSREWRTNPRFVVQADTPVVGQFDPVRLRQLLGNLVDNAVKFSSPGAEITVRVWSEGNDARLTVSDHGIGIPPEDLPHLFERFHRGRNVDDRRYPGLGLGLYICRGIVKEHGGQIWAESSIGRGSTFHVVLPLAPRANPPTTRSTERSPAMPDLILPSPEPPNPPLAIQPSFG